jgi:hypothetical protein
MSLSIFITADSVIFQITIASYNADFCRIRHIGPNLVSVLLITHQDKALKNANLNRVTDISANFLEHTGCGLWRANQKEYGKGFHPRRSRNICDRRPLFHRDICSHNDLYRQPGNG